jgi:IPT/TIG domain
MLRSAIVSFVVVVALAVAAAAAGAAVPVIEYASPLAGTVEGGTTVNIYGSGFTPGTTVKFGGNAAASMTIYSETAMSAVSPEGSAAGLAAIKVKNTSGSSASTPADRFEYDATPSGPWLGLDGNSDAAWSGTPEDFVLHNVVYDRGGAPGIDWKAGEKVEVEGKLTPSGEALNRSIEDGMTPVVTIEYKGYTGNFTSDPAFPHTESQISEYVEGFVSSAAEIYEHDNRAYVEAMNEPWGYTTPQYNGAEYARVIAALYKASPESPAYVAAYGADKNEKEEWDPAGWIPAMYEAEPELMTEVRGWSFHPYGPPSGTEFNNSEGIESVPNVRALMTSGQSNIIISEVGYCAHGVNGGEHCTGGSSETETGAQAAESLGTVLFVAGRYREAGWLKALVVYARADGGWAMQEPGGELTAQGKTLDGFGDEYGLLWAPEKIKTPAKAESNPISSSLPTLSMTGIDCYQGTNDCLAVGDYVKATEPYYAPLAESWQGTGWTVQTTPNPGSGYGAVLAGDSCSGSAISNCTAVGSYENASHKFVTLAERLFKGEWSVQTTTNPGSAEDRLASVGCSATKVCIAVGGEKNTGEATRPLFESWNGTSWATQTSPALTGTTEARMLGVYCQKESFCMAVGSKVTTAGKTVPLAERWNGSEWLLTEPPLPGGATGATLDSVSCPKATSCTAVGYSTFAEGHQPLIEQWNGTSWVIEEAVTPSYASSAKLLGVSCWGACTAVGEASSLTIGEQISFAEHWNGHKWVNQSSPHPSARTVFGAVSCKSVEGLDCTAVGSAAGGVGKESALAQRY